MRLLTLLSIILMASACCQSSTVCASVHPLVSAIQLQDTQSVLTILNSSEKYDIDKKILSKALYYAVTLSNAGLTDLLINHNAPINAPLGPENQQMPALAWAVCLEDQAMVKLLITHHADPDISDYNNIPLISLAAWSGNPEIFKAVSENMDIKADYLLSYNRKGSLLHAAAEAPSLELTQYLIEHGLNLQAKDSQNKNILQSAVVSQDIRVVELIVNAGALLAVCDMENKPEHYHTNDSKLASSNTIKKDSILVKPVSLRNITGKKMAADLLAEYTDSDFHRAVIKNDIQTISKMIKEGFDVNQLDNLSATPLMYAALLGHTQSAQLLTDNNADINKPGARAAAPLHMAVLAGQNQMVTLLIAKGADTYAQNYAKVTPLEMAKNTNAASIVEMIKTARANEKTNTDKEHSKSKPVQQETAAAVKPKAPGPDNSKQVAKDI